MQHQHERISQLELSCSFSYRPKSKSLIPNQKAANIKCLLLSLIHEHGGTRTPAPQDRNLMLYPLNHVPLLLAIITHLEKLDPLTSQKLMIFNLFILIHYRYW